MRSYVPRSMATIAPRSWKTKLRYWSGGQTVTLAGGGYQRQLSGNSLYDPDITGAGHQPYGFDQLANMYNRYRVSASRVMVVATNLSTTATEETDVIVFPIKTDAAGNQYEMEYKGAKFGIAGITGQAKTCIIWNKAYTKDLIVNVDDQDTSALTSADPTVTWIWIITLRSSDNTANTNVLALRYLVEYECEFFQVKDMSSS